MFWCSAAAASAAVAVAGHHPVRAHLLQLLPVSPAVLHLVQVAICPPAGHLGLLLHAALDPSTTGSSCLLTSRARAAPALNSSRLSVCAGAITSTSPIVYLLTSRPRLCPASLSLLQQLSESLFKVTKMHPFKFPADCLSSPAALPPCFVDSLFVFTCSVKDSPTSVF